jgi:hypothetical protein
VVADTIFLPAIFLLFRSVGNFDFTADVAA